MKTRQLGKNGPELSVIGLGTWAIGGPWQWGWGPQNDADSIAAIRTSLENGINWIDTAPAYGLGHAEEIVAKALQDFRRDEVFIATKCGLVWDDKRKVRIHLRPESIRQEVENSLRRLNIEQIDLYQHHWPDPNTSLNDSWGEMVRLKEEGKVHYIGVCNYDAKLLEKCCKIQPVQSLQPPLSLVKRDYLDETLPYCLENEIGVVAYSPLQTGLLTGKFNRAKLAKDDWRSRDKYFNEPLISKILDFVEKLRPLAENRGFEVLHLAIAWVLAQKPVTSAIIGARNAGQAAVNVRAAKFELSGDELSRIAEYLREMGEI
ncbi:MAG: aldo/keto reductase [bacterium]